MQAKSPINHPSIEFFLSNNSEYNSDEEILDLLGYNLVETLDEINKQNEVDKVDDVISEEEYDDDSIKQNKVITVDNEMNKVDDVISEEEYDDDSLIYDDANNLQKRKRKRRKKIFLQTKIDE